MAYHVISHGAGADVADTARCEGVMLSGRRPIAPGVAASRRIAIGNGKKRRRRRGREDQIELALFLEARLVLFPENDAAPL
jgi:hypothetical protein